MRAIFILAAAFPALAALSACGRSDEAFRADYRQRSVAMCVGNAPAELAANGLWSEGIRPGIEPICGCTVDRAMTALTTAQLRSQSARADLTPEERAAQSRWFSECTMEYLRSGVEVPPPPIATGPEGGPPPVGEPRVGGAPPEPLPSRARANLAQYVTADDYPAAAIRNNEQGRVAFSLAIDANGRVTNCAITTSSGSAALDMATCRIMRSRARYTPARDANGKAIASQDRAAVSWVLPKE
jgi:TonB family protein